MIQATTNFLTWINSYSGGKIVYAIEIAGYSRVFTNAAGTGATGEFPYLGDIDDFSQTLSDLDGGSDQVSFGFAVQDNAGDITSDFPGFTFEGKIVTIKMGSLSLAYSDYCSVFVGQLDTVDSINSNVDYYFNVLDLTSLLSAPVYETGDDGLTATSSSNLKTLIGHPLDIMLDILENQLGIDMSLIDTTTITNYRDNIFSGVEFKFELDQAPAAFDFIKVQLLKPLGGYLWQGGGGTIGVHFFYPTAGPSSVMTLDESVFTGVPAYEQTDLVNVVQMQFDKGTGTGGYAAVDTEEFGTSITKYGQSAEQSIAADGVRSAFQGSYIAKFTARLIFLRYGFKNLKFDQNASDTLLKTVLLEPGDVVAVTHALVPDRAAGTIGITGKLFEVVGKKFRWQDGVATLSMIDASYLSSFGFFKIAPTGHVDYASSSPTDKGKYMFMTDDSGKYSTGADGNPLG